MEEENGGGTLWYIIGIVMGLLFVTIAVLIVTLVTFAVNVGSEAEETSSIVDLALTDDNLTTLTSAVVAAGLDEVLAGEGPFTVFAPTDTAFTAALDELGLTLDELVADEATLRDILRYHVVSGAVPAETVLTLDGENVETLLEGATISINVVDDVVLLNEGVNIVQTDIQASNGIIHVIDRVLLPPTEEPAPEVTAEPEVTVEPEATEEPEPTEETEPTPEPTADALN